MFRHIDTHPTQVFVMMNRFIRKPWRDIYTPEIILARNILFPRGRYYFSEEDIIFWVMNHFGEEKNQFHREEFISATISARKTFFPRGSYYFGEEDISSTKKKSFPWGRSCFRVTEIMPTTNGYISDDHHLTSYPFNPVIRTEVIPSSRKFFFIVKYFFLVETFLLCENVSSLAETISSLQKRFFPVEMISSWWKWFIPRGNNIFLDKMISPSWQGSNSFLVEIRCSYRKWFVPRGNDFWHIHVPLRLPHYHRLTCTYATKLKISNNC